MAASVIESVEDKFDTLAFANKPTRLWFDVTPLNNTDGTPVTFPIAQFFHRGAPYGTTLEYTAMADWLFEFRVTDVTLASLEAVVLGILYNGSPPESALGFAYGTFTLPSGYSFLSMEMLGDGPTFGQSMTYRAENSAPVYQATWQMLLRTGPANA